MSNTCPIITIRIPYEGEICYFLFQLVELLLSTTAAVCDILQMDDDSLKKRYFQG